MMDDKKNLFNRRGALKLAASGAALLPGLVSAQPLNMRGFLAAEVPERPSFSFAQLKYGEGLTWNPYPTSARSLMEILVKRTSVPAEMDRVDVTPAGDKLFKNPFLYWTGTREFDPLPEEDIDRLRLYLTMGGFMVVDDALSVPGVGFDKSFQRELARIFPGRKLKRLPDGHTVYKSYYLIDKAVGRTATSPHLSGIDIGDLTVLIHSSNDMGGAWARDRAGKPVAEVTPGGELQREMAVRLGVNLVLYALCANYKQDLVHVEFISERRRGGRE